MSHFYGCNYDSAHTYSQNYSLTDIEVDPPKPKHTFEDRVTGGELFKLYCSSCHNGRPLSERDFRSTEAAMSHMRTQAYLTGVEYRKLMHYVRRWHNLGPPIPERHDLPKRFFYAQPIMELAPESESIEPGTMPSSEEVLPAP